MLKVLYARMNFGVTYALSSIVVRSVLAVAFGGRPSKNALNTNGEKGDFSFTLIVLHHVCFVLVQSAHVADDDEENEQR